MESPNSLVARVMAERAKEREWRKETARRRLKFAKMDQKEDQSSKPMASDSASMYDGSSTCSSIRRPPDARINSQGSKLSVEALQALNQVQVKEHVASKAVGGCAPMSSRPPSVSSSSRNGVPLSLLGAVAPSTHSSDSTATAPTQAIPSTAGLRQRLNAKLGAAKPQPTEMAIEATSAPEKNVHHESVRVNPSPTIEATPQSQKVALKKSVELRASVKEFLHLEAKARAITAQEPHPADEYHVPEGSSLAPYDAAREKKTWTPPQLSIEQLLQPAVASPPTKPKVSNRIRPKSTQEPEAKKSTTPTLPPIHRVTSAPVMSPTKKKMLAEKQAKANTDDKDQPKRAFSNPPQLRQRTPSPALLAAVSEKPLAPAQKKPILRKLDKPPLAERQRAQQQPPSTAPINVERTNFSKPPPKPAKVEIFEPGAFCKERPKAVQINEEANSGDVFMAKDGVAFSVLRSMESTAASMSASNNNSSQDSVSMASFVANMQRRAKFQPAGEWDEGNGTDEEADVALCQPQPARSFYAQQSHAPHMDSDSDDDAPVVVHGRNTKGLRRGGPTFAEAIAPPKNQRAKIRNLHDVDSDVEQVDFDQPQPAESSPKSTPRQRYGLSEAQFDDDAKCSSSPLEVPVGLAHDRPPEVMPTGYSMEEKRLMQHLAAINKKLEKKPRVSSKGYSAQEPNVRQRVPQSAPQSNHADDDSDFDLPPPPILPLNMRPKGTPMKKRVPSKGRRAYAAIL